MLNKLLRFFIRCRYFNRNYELNRWTKQFEKALVARLDIIIKLPMSGRLEVVANDPVLICARKIKKCLDDFDTTTGVFNATK